MRVTQGDTNLVKYGILLLLLINSCHHMARQDKFV